VSDSPRDCLCYAMIRPPQESWDRERAGVWAAHLGQSQWPRCGRGGGVEL